MVLVNYTTRELTAKLVFYGPGLCGKTTNLQYIFENLLPPDRRGKMVSLNTETDRTLFFDFLPLELGTIRGLKTRLQLYTVPGQVHYNATRKIVLKGADGIVFVADSQRTKREGNIESYKNMKQNLAEHGLDLRNVPFVLQFNKRDLPDVMGIDEMAADLNEYNVPFWEAVAVEGIGVEDTLKGLVRLVMKNLAGRFQSDGKDAAAAPAAAPAVAPALEAPPIAAAPPFAEPVAAPAPFPAAFPAAPTPAPAPFPAMPAAAAPGPFPAAFPAPPAAPPPAPFFQPAPAAAVPAPPPPPLFSAPAASAPAAPAPWPAAPPSSPLELSLDAEPEGEVLDLGDDQLLPADSPALDVGSAFDAALTSGDTIVAPMGFGAPAPPAPEPSFPSMRGPQPVAADLEAALLSGDTVMSLEPPAGLLDAMPEAPVFTPPPAGPGPLDLGGGDLESALLGESPLGMPEPGGLDLESALMGGTASEPEPLQDFALPAPAAPEPEVADFAMPAPVREPEAAAELPGVLEVDATLQLGRVAAGEMVRRLVRVPIEFEDASGRRRTTLTVRLEFRVD